MNNGTSTIETLALQEILDKNWQWFFVDRNPPGVSIGGICTFDGPPVDGKPCRCALGCLMPDSLLRVASQCTSIYGLVGNRDIAKLLIGLSLPFPGMEVNPRFIALRDLQICHDGAVMDGGAREFRQRYFSRLRGWAMKHNLQWPGPLTWDERAEGDAP